MNTTTNHIPKNWNTGCQLSFLKWMAETIKSEHYSEMK